MIRKELKNFINNDNLDLLLKNACQNGLNKLEKWFISDINENSLNTTYINIFIAIILDPHYKNKIFNKWNLNNKQQDLILKKFKNIYNIIKNNYINNIIINII